MNITITDVRYLPGDSAFLIDDGQTSVLYDSGFGFTAENIVKNIKNVLGQRELDYIFLTHSHYDHALASAYITAHYPNCTVVGGSYADSIFKRPGARATMRELDGKFALQCGISEYEFAADRLRIDKAVNDLDIIRAGDMIFTAIELPGHTKCSVAYYLESERLLLSTETPGIYDGEKSILPSFLVGFEMTMESIAKLKKMDIQRILMPHVGLLDEKQTSYYLSVIEETNKSYADLIVQKLKGGISEEELTEYFIKTYRKGYFEEIYPTDAMRLNTSIMIKLIRKEFNI